jgi:hypothetical protein
LFEGFLEEATLKLHRYWVIYLSYFLHGVPCLLRRIVYVIDVALFSRGLCVLAAQGVFNPSLHVCILYHQDVERLANECVNKPATALAKRVRVHGSFLRSARHQSCVQCEKALWLLRFLVLRDHLMFLWRFELLKVNSPSVVFDCRLLHVLMCELMTQGTLL